MNTRMNTCHDHLREQLADADQLLDESLKAIHLGMRTDAMEAVYTVSCLIEDIRAALADNAACDAASSAGAGNHAATVDTGCHRPRQLDTRAA